MQEVNVLLKYPYGQDFSVRVPLSMSVTELKQKIATEHPEKPPIDKQRIFCYGRPIQDNEYISNLIRPEQNDLVLHLMIRRDPSTTNQNSTNRNNVGQQQQWGPYTGNFGQYAGNFGQQYPGNYSPFYPPQNVHGVYAQQWPGYGNIPNNFPQQPYYQGQYQGFQGMAGVGQLGPQGVHRVGFARVNIDFSLIIKLLLLVFVLGQGAGERMPILIALAIAYYLYQTGIARFQFIRVGPNNVQGPPGAQPQAPQVPVGGQDPAQPPREHNNNVHERDHNNNIENNNLYQFGPAREVVNFFVPLVCSLLPSWQPPENMHLPPVNQQPQDERRQEN